MTLLSKANLEVAAIASTNQFDGALNGVFLAPDGSTVACDGMALVAVGPTQAETHFPDVGPRATPGSHGVVLRPDFIAEVKTIIPKDKRISLQHVAMTVGVDPSKTEFTTIDKSGRTRSIAEWPKKDRYPEWQQVVRKALTPKEPGKEVVRVCVDRKSLLAVLKTVVDACPENGDAPIFLEIGSGVVLRAVNRETRQHVIGVAAAHRSGGSWMERDSWEKDVMGDEKPTEIKEKSIRKIIRISKK